MGEGGRKNKETPPRWKASTETLIRRIENHEAFDPNALLNLLEGDEEADEVSIRGDSSSYVYNEHDGSGLRRGGAAGGEGGRQQRENHITHRTMTSMPSSVMSRQSRQSNITMITHINNSGNQAPSVMSRQSRQSNMTMITHINNSSNQVPSSSGASVYSDNSSYFGTTSSAGSIASAIAAAKQNWRDNRENINWMSASIFLLLFSLYSMYMHRQSLEMFRGYTNGKITPSKITGLGGGGGGADTPFAMCDRETPYRYSLNPATDRSSQQRPEKSFRHDWPKQNKILLLRNDGKFGNIGNQMQSLLHAFDYARDHNLHLGMLFHSWAMDVIQSVFYETDDFDALVDEMMTDFGVLVVRNQTQLTLFDEVVSENAQQLYFYKSSNKKMDHWRETMEVHKSIIQQLFFRYNRGYGYVHNGLRAQDVCGTLDTLFKGHVGDVKYSVIHSRFLDDKTLWKLNKIAKSSGLTVEGGVISMGPAYVKSILKPLGMLEYPILLITDRSKTGAERGLLNDPDIGPKLMVLSDREKLDGADVALAVLSDVYIGNPASVTSGFVARARMALGYSEKSTQLFRRKRIHHWYSVCNEECVFNPWIMSNWV